MDQIYIPLICGIVGLLFALSLVFKVMKEDRGPKEVSDISDAIETGALAFLYREYKTLAFFVVIMFVILAVFLEPQPWVGVSYLMGTFCSVLTGYIGMRVGVKANCRTTTAVRKSLNAGLRVAFNSGAVMGLTVVSLGLVGLSVAYLIWGNYNSEIMQGVEFSDFAKVVVGFGFGASSIALFARVGGGIYTKGADVGSDLVGKVEAGIPEDDPRNPGVIADNVGDNVGDIAGMGADLFESYVGSIVATLTVAIAAGISIANDGGLPSQELGSKGDLVLLPLIIAGVAIICSIIGTFFVRTGKEIKLEALLAALRRGVYVASFLTIGATALVIWLMDIPDVAFQRFNGDTVMVGGWDIFIAIIAGLVGGVLIGLSIEYYTSYTYKPTRTIAESSSTGTGTLIIKGFATGMMSTLIPVGLVIIAVLVAYWLADLYGVAISAVGMLSTLGITLATDAYGPVADNAGGIAEQAHLPKDVREKTDALDSLGNTTAATGKGFAIGSAALTALGLTAAFGQTMSTEGAGLTMRLDDPKVVMGAFIGAVLVFLFCGLTMNAVGKAAMGVVEEVRRQWREIPGLKEGKAGVKPDYARCVDMSTKSALQQMILPGLLAVIVPVAVGFAPFLGPEALAGLLIGSIVTGFVMAVTMANAGGAWDNAKKYIEAGNLGGKGSPAHKAAVVGDTLGDPFKDTSGPSLNILIKLMSVVALLFAPAFATVGGGAPDMITELPNVTQNSAIMIGTMNSLGTADEVDVYFEYSPVRDFEKSKIVTATQTITDEDMKGKHAITFQKEVKGLEAGKTYYYRVVGDGDKTDRGRINEFTIPK
ncbi:MAG: sodium-translocating pyrophosphatase [Dehalococcoidia bacterium]